MNPIPWLLGAFVVSYSVYTLVRRGPARVIGAGWAWLAGLCGGITSALFGAGGPPYAVYLSQRGLSKEQFRATMGFATMTSISLRVVAFLISGLLLDRTVWMTAVAAVPSALLGLWIARRFYLRISRETLMRVVALILTARSFTTFDEKIDRPFRRWKPSRAPDEGIKFLEEDEAS